MQHFVGYVFALSALLIILLVAKNKLSRQVRKGKELYRIGDTV